MLSYDHDHRQHRSFFGPIPEQVLARLQHHDDATLSNEDHSHGDQPAGLIERHAFTFFLSEGGRPEDWNEEARISIKRTLMDRWLETEWGKALQLRQAHKSQPERWVGDSFEIGDFLGLSILSPPRHSAPSRRSLNTSQPAHPDDIQPDSTESVPLASGIGPQPVELPTAGPSKPPNLDAEEPNGRSKISVVTATARMPVDASIRVTQHALGQSVGNSIYGADDTIDVSGVASPVPLLAETNMEEQILRDRMLVHVYYSDISFSSQVFNEEIHRTSRNLQYEACSEFLVVWRRDRIEIYRDHTFPIQEWISGHKALAFTIPLSSTTARLSLYSFVDLSFSITCRRGNRHETLAGLPLTSLLSREGSRFFVFKLKSRSRAYDWVWKLWLRLGGSIPNTIEVKNPALNATVSIGVPQVDGDNYDKVLETFSRQNVIDLGVMGLSTLPDWNSLIHLALLHGKRLELAWRVGTNLDWIRHEIDVDEKTRKWAVLCGLAMRESTRGAVLELRLAEHFPDHIYLKDGDRVNEPPGVEGYLKRIHPNSSIKHSTYLSTHDGNLFVLRTDRAYPPTPPGLFPHSVPSESSAKGAEIRRGVMQIMHASGVCDLRKILVVRCAFQSVTLHARNEHGLDRQDNAPPRNGEPSVVDDDEDRGEEADGDLGRQMHKRRTFELLLENGNVIRFQAHSYRVAREWINRLRTLVSYWKERHRSDAEHEMNLAQASRPRLTPLMSKCQEHAPVSLPDALPTLMTMYTSTNWCMIEGCRPIIRGGKLFMKKGLRGQYRLIQMFLVTNHLVRYRLKPKSSLHSGMKKIGLDDAYVCSGYWAAIALPDGEFNPCNPSVGRRYQDGLETNDREEDTMFMIYYISPKSTTDTLYHTNTSDIPPISAKRKTLFFRTRSKLERDSWCWAINCEIERTVRMQRNRENVIRNSGNLTP